MWDALGGTRTVLTRRDETTSAERFIVSFDPYRTQRLAYSVAVTVAGLSVMHTSRQTQLRNTCCSAKARALGWCAVWNTTLLLTNGDGIIEPPPKTNNSSCRRRRAS